MLPYPEDRNPFLPGPTKDNSMSSHYFLAYFPEVALHARYEAHDWYDTTWSLLVTHLVNKMPDDA